LVKATKSKELKTGVSSSSSSLLSSGVCAAVERGAAAESRETLFIVTAIVPDVL
jgi:hypothetical protein